MESIGCCLVLKKETAISCCADYELFLLMQLRKLFSAALILCLLSSFSQHVSVWMGYISCKHLLGMKLTEFPYVLWVHFLCHKLGNIVIQPE
jgi:hypothetical protein